MATDYRQGDYRVVADRLRPASAQLVGWAAPAAGDLVVDVGAGSGNLARLCAARGARAVAVDRVREQLLLGAGEGPGVDWLTGDARALPLRDRVADAALSVFALIYAEQPDLAVAELGRVTRPGGLIGLTAWPADGYQQAFTQLLVEYADVPPAHDHLAVWGGVGRIRQMLSPVADDVEVRTGELVGRWASVDAWWREREQTPPIAGPRSRLDAEEYDELGRRMREIAGEFGEQGEDFVLRDTYLLALGRRR
jgi:SAM-dependent methyltransferase